MENHTKEKTKDTFEQVKGKGKEAFENFKDIVKEGNIRSVVIKNKHGKTIAEFPLTLGVVGLAFAPLLASIATIFALVKECSIYVEKRD